MTFAALFVSEKREKKKVSLCFYTAAASSTLSRRRRPSLLRKSVNSRPTIELKSRQQPKQEIKSFIPLSRRRQHTCFAYVLIPAFSFDEEGAKEKAIKKKSADEELSHSAERDKGDLPLPQPPFEKGG